MVFKVPDSSSPGSASMARWGLLFRIGSVSSLLAVVAILLSVVSFFIWPPFPNDILSIIHRNHFAGIMSLDVLYLVAVLLTLPLVLCLFVLLRSQNESLALIALVTGIIGVVLIILARPIVEMVSLSDRYAAAATETDRLAFLAAAKATLELFNGTSYYLHILMGNISFVTSAALMTKSPVFRKSTAVLGIVTNSIAFGIFIPTVGPFFGFLFLLGFVPWLVILSVNLFNYSRDR